MPFDELLGGARSPRAAEPPGSPLGVFDMNGYRRAGDSERWFRCPWCSEDVDGQQRFRDHTALHEADDARQRWQMSKRRQQIADGRASVAWARGLGEAQRVVWVAAAARGTG